MPHPRQLATTPHAETLEMPEGPTAAVPRRLVPRLLVHRASAAETLLIGAAGIDTDRFTVLAEWPRAHRLHVSPDGSACPAIGPAPAEPVPRTAVSDVPRRAGRPTGSRHDAEAGLGEVRVMAAYLAAIWTGAAVHRRLRGGRTATTVPVRPAPPGLPPATVGRVLPADVVLAPAETPRRPTAASRYRTSRFLRPPARSRARRAAPGGRLSGRTRPDPDRSPDSAFAPCRLPSVRRTRPAPMDRDRRWGRRVRRRRASRGAAGGVEGPRVRGGY